MHSIEEALKRGADKSELACKAVSAAGKTLAQPLKELQGSPKDEERMWNAQAFLVLDEKTA
jgi:hypothetical protein